LSESSSSGGGGLGIAGVAIVVLVTLKLAGVAPVADWSWAFVIFAPILAALVFVFLLIGVVGGVLGVGVAGLGISEWFGRRKMRNLMEKADKAEAEENE